MRRKTWLNALKFALTLASLYLIARNVDFRSLIPILKQCRLGFLVASIASLVVNSILTAWRWRMLWKVHGLPLRKFLYFVYLGYFFSAFVPSSATSEAIRIIAFGRKYGAVQESIGVNLLARGMGLILQLGIGAGSLWIYREELHSIGFFGKLRVNDSTLLVAAALAILAGGILFGMRTRIARQRWLAEIGRILRDAKLVAGAAGITLLIQVISILGLWWMFMSLFPSVRLWQIVLFPAIIQLILLLPVSFGGVGVREYLNLLFFSDIAGIPRNTVFAVSILGYVPVFMLALAGWTWMTYRRLHGRA